MASKRIVARNVLFNLAGMATRMATGFVVLPLLVYRLDVTGYGLWTLIASCTGYFGLLDLGMRGSLGRNIAYARAKDDQEGISVLISSGLAFISAAGLVAVLGTSLIVVVFFWLVEVPSDQVIEVRWALTLAGLGMASTLAFSVFDSTLWAYQRFDVINAIEILGSILRVVLTFALVTGDHGLITLSVLALGIGLGGDLLKAVMCFWLIPGLRLRPHFVQRSALRTLFDYGSWNFIGSIGRKGSEESGPWIVGNQLGPALVTPFAAAWRLLGYAVQALTVSAEAITPVATSLHAQEKSSHQQQLFLEGSKFALALGLFFLGGFLFLGESFLSLWIGPRFADASVLLVILMLGELLPMSQIITRSILLGMGKPRIPATLSIMENLIAIPLALLVAVPYGLLGICIVIASVAATVRGLGMIIMGCRNVQVPLSQLALRSFLPAVVCGAAPIGLLGILASSRAPVAWPELIAYGLAYAVVYGALVVLVLIGVRPLLQRGSGLIRRRTKSVVLPPANAVGSIEAKDLTP